MEILAGSKVSFEYPAANYPNAPPRWELRRLQVDQVRYLDEEPLDPLTLQLNPALCRQGPLITGFDLDRLGERSFYQGSMRNLRLCHDDETHSVIWFEAEEDEEWTPGSCQRLPEGLQVVGSYVEGVSGVIAHVIADGGNAFLRKCGERKRWLAAVDWHIPTDKRESA